MKGTIFSKNKKWTILLSATRGIWRCFGYCVIMRYYSIICWMILDYYNKRSLGTSRTSEGLKRVVGMWATVNTRIRQVCNITQTRKEQFGYWWRLHYKLSVAVCVCVLKTKYDSNRKKKSCWCNPKPDFNLICNPLYLRFDADLVDAACWCWFSFTSRQQCHMSHVNGSA